MNQILVVGNNKGKKSNSTVDIKKIILIFSIALIIFGGVLLVEGVLGLTKKEPKNDSTAQNPIFVQTPTPSTEEPTAEDNQQPEIELILIGENIKIIARDETEIDYIEYGWNNDEKQIAKRSDDKNKIEATIKLQEGTNTLKVRAVDKAGNAKSRENDFEKKYKPKLQLLKNPEGDALLIQASCEDGIGRIDFTQNGSTYRLPVQDANYTKEEFESIGAEVEYSEDGKIVKVVYTYKNLLEGENRFSVYVYSTKGEVEGKDGTLTYTAQQ